MTGKNSRVPKLLLKQVKTIYNHESGNIVVWHGLS